MWLKWDVKYDPAKEQVGGDEEANKLLARTIRRPWQLQG